MAEAQEKRAARRFALRIPVAVSQGENSVQTQTAQIRDVSARGICLYLDSSVTEGSPISFTLTLPPEITLTESIRDFLIHKSMPVDIRHNAKIFREKLAVWAAKRLR